MCCVHECSLYNYFSIFVCLKCFHNKIFRKNYRYSFKSLIEPWNCWYAKLFWLQVLIEKNLFNLKIFIKYLQNFCPTNHILKWNISFYEIFMKHLILWQKVDNIPIQNKLFFPIQISPILKFSTLNFNKSKIRILCHIHYGLLPYPLVIFLIQQNFRMISSMSRLLF